SGIFRALRLLELWFLTYHEGVSGHRSHVLVSYQFETLFQKGAEHGTDAFHVGAFWDLRADVEAVPFEPTRATDNLVGIELVGGADQVHHCGVPDFVTAIARRGGADELHGGFGTDVHVGDLEFRCRVGGLCVEQGEGTNYQNESVHVGHTPSVDIIMT